MRGRASSHAAVLAALCLLTGAGGALDAWAYLLHGHVFANAQTGNVVLIGIALAADSQKAALGHLPSLATFIFGLLISPSCGRWLKRRSMNSRTARLGLECILLVSLAAVAGDLHDGIITAVVGFIAAIQIASVSHVGTWSFNTGNTTGNLRAAAMAFVALLDGDVGQRKHALVMAALCLAFPAGAVLGAWLAPRMGDATLLVIAMLVGTAALLCRHLPDPLPDWTAASSSCHLDMK